MAEAHKNLYHVLLHCVGQRVTVYCVEEVLQWWRSSLQRLKSYHWRSFNFQACFLLSSSVNFLKYQKHYSIVPVFKILKLEVWLTYSCILFFTSLLQILRLQVLYILFRAYALKCWYYTHTDITWRTSSIHFDSISFVISLEKSSHSVSLVKQQN